jgi:hypothetical protein
LARWLAFLPVALVFTFLYPLGVPLYLFRLLAK